MELVEQLITAAAVTAVVFMVGGGLAIFAYAVGFAHRKGQLDAERG